MRKIQLLSLLLFISVAAIGQRKVIKKSFPSNYQYKTECVGKDFSGNPKMQAWGEANSKKEAIKKAYQTALDHILFENTRGNTNDCTLMPLVKEADAEVEYAKYFRRLLYTGKGSIMKYMEKSDDEVWVYKDKKDDEFLAKVIVTVKRDELYKKMVRKDIMEKYKKEKKLYK